MAVSSAPAPQFERMRGFGVKKTTMKPTHQIRVRFFTNTPEGMKQRSTEEYITAYSSEEAVAIFDQQIVMKKKGMDDGGMWAYMVTLIDASTQFILKEKTVR